MCSAPSSAIFARKYAEKYRILRADSGPAALDLLRKLEQRNDPVALLLADHRMPQMNGIEFLAEAMKIYPECVPRIADSLRRYRRGHSGDQRNQAASLPAEAVGSAGRESVSGHRRTAGRLARGVHAAVRRAARAGQPMVAEVLRFARISGA